MEYSDKALFNLSDEEAKVIFDSILAMAETIAYNHQDLDPDVRNNLLRSIGKLTETMMF